MSGVRAGGSTQVATCCTHVGQRERWKVKGKVGVRGYRVPAVIDPPRARCLHMQSPLVKHVAIRQAHVVSISGDALPSVRFWLSVDAVFQAFQPQVTGAMPHGVPRVDEFEHLPREGEQVPEEWGGSVMGQSLCMSMRSMNSVPGR